MATEDIQLKASLPPIANSETEILILGTLPGDRSLELGEYFAHPRNRFWKIIAGITHNPLPLHYSEKLDLLLKNKIGAWNVLQKAERKGSSDNAIRNAIPNNIPAFLDRHEHVKVIGFDGKRPETFYDRYFSRRSGITYLSLPGCSPANARFNLEALCSRWAKIFE